MEHKVTKMEIEELCNQIKRIEKKCLNYYLGIGFGGVIALIAIIYFLINPDIIAGSLSLLLIGAFVVFLNVISIKQAKARIESLTKDLKLLQDVFYNQIEY